MDKIRELHLFAGIGGGIYGGQLIGHSCCAAMDFTLDDIMEIIQE
jgi:site-specific DNA-cytosine methylase